MEKWKVSYTIDLKLSRQIIEITKHQKGLFVLFEDLDGESKLGISEKHMNMVDVPFPHESNNIWMLSLFSD